MPVSKCSAHTAVTPSKAKSNGSIIRTGLLAFTWSLSTSHSCQWLLLQHLLWWSIMSSKQPLIERPQVAPQPNTPFNEINPQSPNQQQANPSETGNALENPNSLASEMQPSDSDLSAANQELLSRNAQLQRDVNDLETRVNVLINERSGQLFMYGAVTVAVSLFLGVLLGGFIFSRRDRW